MIDTDDPSELLLHLPPLPNETAALLVDVLQDLIEHVESRYSYQIRQHYQDLNRERHELEAQHYFDSLQYRLPLDDHIPF